MLHLRVVDATKRVPPECKWFFQFPRFILYGLQSIVDGFKGSEGLREKSEEKRELMVYGLWFFSFVVFVTFRGYFLISPLRPFR